MKMRPGPWLALAIVVGVAIRVALLPTTGYADDLTQFVEWVRHIALTGLPNAYDAPLSFGPVMAFVWGILAALDPAFRTAVDASDIGVRILLKLPGTLADLGLAAGVWYALRARPGWAAAGAAVILLHPAIWFVSAWWGQYESIFALLVLIAYLLATTRRDALAVVALTAALLTKPQVAPLVVPFAAWFLARIGWRSSGGLGRLAILGLVALATTVVLWLPFVAAGGPAKYLANLATYQNGVYSVLSLNAWNLWWLIQELFAGGSLVGDNQAFLGPLTFRLAGVLLTGLLLVAVGYGVYRRPTARTLALGVATAALVAFAFLTTMHERYAYAAFVFLAILIDDRRARWIALALGVVFTLNLVAAASKDYLGGILDVTGPVGIAGAVAIVAIALVLVFEMLRASGASAATTGGGTPLDTNAGSAGATSAA
jgi:dolichyl-phosphate-mannose-protein mannosyltransferase